MSITTHTVPWSDQETTAGAPALELREVTLAYPDGKGPDGAPRTITALDRVCLAVVAGTMTALTGPSGSGKSSLLAVASTLLNPTSGEVRIGGVAVGNLSEKDRARLRREEVGTVFQQPNLIPSLRAEDQLVVTSHIRGARGGATRHARERARQLLELVGLEGAGRRRPHELSGGQRQRVNIARALMGEPKLLLVDEPTSALDQQRSAEVMQLLKNLTRTFDLATVVVTHDLEFVDMADREVTMLDGTLAG